MEGNRGSIPRLRQGFKANMVKGIQEKKKRRMGFSGDGSMADCVEVQRGLIPLNRAEGRSQVLLALDSPNRQWESSSSSFFSMH